MNKELSIILPVRNEKESLEIMVRLLNSTLQFTFEVLIVFDNDKDNSVPVANSLIKEFSNIKLIHNQRGYGVKNAIDAGVKIAKYEIILINAVDEIFPIISIEKMVDLILDQDFDLISGTRYSKGGLRIGGSLIGSILSKFANKLFKYITEIPISDCTTGIKMMKKSVWQNTKFTSKPVGWVFAFELSIKSWIAGYKISEYPLKSVDRLFGGSSTFKPMPWIREYFRCFMWGLKQAKKLKHK
jgi:dolichol-phosphate mannosyltransferase